MKLFCVAVGKFLFQFKKKNSKKTIMHSQLNTGVRSKLKGCRGGGLDLNHLDKVKKNKKIITLQKSPGFDDYAIHVKV